MKHSSVPVLVFTEQGVSMLSSVLRTEHAILINIEIMRTFTRFRNVVEENENIRKEIHRQRRKSGAFEDETAMNVSEAVVRDSVAKNWMES